MIRFTKLDDFTGLHIPGPPPNGYLQDHESICTWIPSFCNTVYHCQAQQIKTDEWHCPDCNLTISYIDLDQLD